MTLAHASIKCAGPILLVAALGGCSLEAAMTSCAQCGEVQSITPRVARSDIRLPTPLDAYRPAEVVPVAGRPIMFQVRVRMDRGGSRDFFVPQADLSVGDRVEVRGGALVPRETASLRWS